MMTSLKNLSYIVVDEEVNHDEIPSQQHCSPEEVNMIDAVSKILVDGSSKHVLPPIQESKVTKDKDNKRQLSDSCLHQACATMDNTDDSQGPIIQPSPRQRSLSLTPKGHTSTGQLTRRRSEVKSDLVGRRRRSSNSQELQAGLLAVTQDRSRPDSSLDLV